jgi:hypothetical protein
MNLNPWVGGGPCIHLRLGFFFDSGDDDMDSPSARGVEQEKRKSSIASNQTQPGDRL